MLSAFCPMSRQNQCIWKIIILFPQTTSRTTPTSTVASRCPPASATCLGTRPPPSSTGTCTSASGNNRLLVGARNSHMLPGCSQSCMEGMTECVNKIWRSCIRYSPLWRKDSKSAQHEYGKQHWSKRSYNNTTSGLLILKKCLRSLVG